MTKFLSLLPAFLLLLALSSCRPHDVQPADETEWTALFDGESLSGWETFLSVQPGVDTEIYGVNNDPKGVFSVADGAIRISGEVWGGLTTVEEYENYHLRMEFKWGDKKWPPREDSPRDTGLLFHAYGPHGAAIGHWLTSHEFQILEGSVGDYHSLMGPTIDVQARTGIVDGDTVRVFEEGAPLQTGVAGRVVKSEDAEKPHGEWNRLELIADGADFTYIVNDVVVLRASNSRRAGNGQEVPLTRGRIQIQSEAAEVFLRNIEIRPLGL